MALSSVGLEIYTQECQIKPNRYAVRAVFGIVMALVLATVLNALGVFEVEPVWMYGSLAGTLLLYGFLVYLTANDERSQKPSTKYIVMTALIVMTMLLSILLNLNVTLALVIPILLAMQYRSKRITILATAGSCICGLVAPIAAYFAHTWSFRFLSGYIETVCGISVVPGPGCFTAGECVWRITLYLGLPQTLILLAFSVICQSVTHSRIQSLQDQIRVNDLGRELEAKIGDIAKMRDQLLYAMMDMIETRDAFTGEHIKRTIGVVEILTDAIRRDGKWQYPDRYWNDVVRAAPMHDIGKVAVNDSILKKQTPLNDEEWAVIRTHPVRSGEIIRNTFPGLEDEEFIRVAERMARSHHEHYDGSGYPDGLKEDDIPLEARIMAIADVYDALVSERPYKKAFSSKEAYDIIDSSFGTQFDPALKPYFAACREQIESFYR